MKLGLTAMFALAIATGGCAPRAFVRTDGPVQSSGVSIALVHQSCDRQIDPNWSYADILGLDVQIRVANTGPSSLLFDPRAMTLLANGWAHSPHRADAPMIIAPGQLETFAVHFLERDDNLACNVPMALVIGSAATVNGLPVVLRPISFLASNKDV
jgi:hypothetical protein